MFTQMKFPNREVLRNVNPNLFHKYMDYLLGEHVHGLKAKDAHGEVVSAPSLELVLSYEYQIAKAMVKSMNEGKMVVVCVHRAGIR